MPSLHPDAIAAASMCLWRDGEVLLVLRPEGVWAFPGGKVEPGEAPAEAAVREIYEETGLHTEAGRLIGEFEIVSSTPGKRFHLSCFLGRWITGEAIAASDARDVRWVKPPEHRKLRLAPHVKSVISLAEEMIRV